MYIVGARHAAAVYHQSALPKQEGLCTYLAPCTTKSLTHIFPRFCPDTHSTLSTATHRPTRRPHTQINRPRLCSFRNWALIMLSFPTRARVEGDPAKTPLLENRGFRLRHRYWHGLNPSLDVGHDGFQECEGYHRVLLDHWGLYGTVIYGSPHTESTAHIRNSRRRRQGKAGLSTILYEWAIWRPRLP